MKVAAAALAGAALPIGAAGAAGAATAGDHPAPHTGTSAPDHLTEQPGAAAHDTAEQVRGTVEAGHAAHAKPGPADRAPAPTAEPGRAAHAKPAPAAHSRTAKPAPAGEQAKPAKSAEPAANAPNGASVDHGYLMDAGAGGLGHKQMWGQGSSTELPMASTTKIMTAMVVLHQQNLDLNKHVTIKQEYRDYVAKKGASNADLKTGDTLTVRQLLYAMMLPSGCDAAYALADTYGHGATTQARVASFIGQMNTRAASLGMTGTHYDSFDGISNGNNHSTAHDLAILGQQALLSPTFQQVVSAPQTVQKATAANGHTRTYTWNNTDELLTSYKGAIGIKTGSGPEDGYCLVFAAKKHGRTLVGAILKDGDDRFKDAAKLLDWGFAHAG